MAGRSARLGIDIEEARQQRAAVILCDVDYLIHARIGLTERAGPDDSVAKYVEMFRRRAACRAVLSSPLSRDQGVCRRVRAGRDEALQQPITDTRDLGWMLYDIDYSGAKPMPLFFEARLDAGILAVPEPNSPELRR